MNTETKQINRKYFDVPRPVIMNYDELVMRQTEDGSLEVHADVPVHDAINGINIVQLIDQNNIDMLYEMDRKGQYRPLNTALHKLFNSLERPSEPYRVCRRVNILRDYPDDKIKIYP